jgi:hypothetical protein
MILATMDMFLIELVVLHVIIHRKQIDSVNHDISWNEFVVFVTVVNEILVSLDKNGVHDLVHVSVTQLNDVAEYN